MKTSRRNFIRSASAAGVLAALPGSVFAQGTAPKPLDILILGGTGFIGPHEINYARSIVARRRRICSRMSRR